jgi:probable F420-dependent oxidoreductase
MKFGTFLPQIGGVHDPVACRDYAQAAEALGYDFLNGYEHVIVADPSDRPPDIRFSFTHESFLHEPFVLFGYLGGLTTRIEFSTSIMILPQRQTALFAKQAAEVDYLTGGRLRLGLGLGWNTYEYEAMGADWHTRGTRVAEQVEVLRALWTHPTIDYKGRWHRIDRAGINPLPVQRPIPIWFGGYADAVLRRTAKIGDGWLPLQRPDDERMLGLLKTLRRYVMDAGRSQSEVGLQGRVVLTNRSPDDWRADIAAWETLDASHVIVSTDEPGFGDLERHMRFLREFAEAAELQPYQSQQTVSLLDS